MSTDTIELRYRHTASTKTRRQLAARSANGLPKAPCLVDGCLSPRGTYGRFCPSHARYRSRHGAAVTSDILSADALKLAVDQLRTNPELVSRLTSGPALRRMSTLVAGPSLSIASPIKTVDPDRHTFSDLAPALSFATQSRLLWRHQDRRGKLISPPDLILSCVAVRWAYLLLARYGALGRYKADDGQPQGRTGWSTGDHQAAYRTVFGKLATKGQALYRREMPPASVFRRLARDIEEEVLLMGTPSQLIPTSDEEFLETLRPLEAHQGFLAQLLQAQSGQPPKP
jgi:hypothetical protein